MKNEVMSKQKQSIVIGGLISSAGIFFAKFIGLFYAIPFNSLLHTSENIAIYGVAFSIYTYVLNICTAGFPFAIATLVAKYAAQGDMQTSLLIKRLSNRLMIGLGLVAMLFMIVMSAPFASMLLPEGATNMDAMRNVLIIIAVALFVVPILSGMRGFYQGLKHMEVYALSQVLEQFARVAFLLGASAIAVYMFHADHVWSVYFGAMSTSIAAVLAILHIKLYDHKQMKEIKSRMEHRKVVHKSDQCGLYKELVFIAFPFLISAILGYCDNIINTFYLKNGLEAYYMKDGALSAHASQEVILVVGAINYGVLKLMSIPMILAPGFTSAIIPHITSALTNQQYALVRKNIYECIEIVLYIGIPISFCLFAYAKPIYACMFPPAGSDMIAAQEALELCADVLRWFSVDAFLGTIAPIFTTLLMAVEMRKKNLRNLAINAGIKLMITYPMLAWFGYPGMIMASIISMGTLILLSAHALSKQFELKWIYTLRKLLVILIGIAGLYGCSMLLSSMGLVGYGNGRLIGICQLGINGLISLTMYFGITYFFGLPQNLLHLDFKKLFHHKAS